MKLMHLRARLLWAKLTRNHLLALITLKEIAMADFSALNDAVARLIAKSQADETALAAANAAVANADASIQPQIDALVQQIDAIAPAPAPEPVEQPTSEQPA